MLLTVGIMASDVHTTVLLQMACTVVDVLSDPKRKGTLKGQLCFSTGVITYPESTPGHPKESMLKCCVADSTGSITVLCYQDQLFAGIQEGAKQG